MHSSNYNVFVIFALAWLVLDHAHAQIDTSINEAKTIPINKVASSSFEMVLYPTPLKFDTSTIQEVTRIIQDLLLVSSTGSSDVYSFDVIEILIEKVESKEYHKHEDDFYKSGSVNRFTEHVWASFLEFRVRVGRYMQDGTSIQSRFDVDTLVVRTFSQPSTKSTFVYLLNKTMDPFLVQVQDIHINLVEKSSNEQIVVERADSLSSIDIILILASSLILVVILCVLITHSRKDGHKDFWKKDSSKRENTISETNNDKRVDEIVNNDSNDADTFQTQLGNMMCIKGNIIEAGSLESSIDSQSQIVLTAVDESPVMSFASSSLCHSNSSSTSSPVFDTSLRVCFEKAIEISVLEMMDTSIDSESMGSKHHHDSKMITKSEENLASKLLSLPNSDMSTGRLKAGLILASSASAPAILQDTIRNWKNENPTDEKFIKYTRSTASLECLKQNRKRDTINLISLVRPIREIQHAMKGFIMLESTEEFHNSWHESKRKALEDIEEGSVDDVFQIDFHRNGDKLENEKNIYCAWRKPVLEWMKLISVVNSASESQSSLENSSIEPRSFYARESCSLDLSLENSLAKSLVDPESK